ncbi:unnamed protein product [Phytophthora fragariaefolia]|uniref:Unnamed protein product n=1 Tax=Phytophthora fragariaefolia TaxID=1490495 RepID=A0A9W7D456_9STRA|nr:unnamed protein product [Phytophthora fragariaefolia]
MSWNRFARDLHDGRIEQICILSDVERMKREAEELKQLVTEGADPLSAKSKKESFDEQSWDSLKSSPLYEVLREYKDVLPDKFPAELPQDKGVQDEIDFVPGTKKNGVRPDPGKVRVINEWPTPSHIKELRQFLGLATYLCKYVSNYAGKIRSLSQLPKKDAVWNWTAECQQALDAVKQGMAEAPILAVADQDRPFHVVCDASDFAIGCALMGSCGLPPVASAEVS